jgi:hypothetical protein
MLSALLADLEAKGKLFRFAPKLRKPLKRRLYLTTEANRNFNDPTSPTNFLPRPSGFVRNAMVRWVSGERIYGDDHRKPHFLKELDPPPCSDIWEIRVTDPTPKVRLIGAFLERDTLVLSCFRTRSLLGKKGSQGWKSAMLGCQSEFLILFGQAPFHANRVGDYISENYDDFDLQR